MVKYFLPAFLLLWAPASQGETKLPDPCKVITKAEAEAIMGEPLRDPEPGGIGGTKYCDFKTVKVYGGITPYWIHIAISSEQQQVWNEGKKLHAKELRPASGIGGDAYFLLEDLDVFTKGRFVTIGVIKSIDKPSHARDVETAERAVAEKVIPRMP